MILVIDNYDSFVHNLARYIKRLGGDYEVYRNDALTLEDISDNLPEAIILSPGPCTPKQAGICIDIVKKFGANIPILGVCLGHQAIAEAYGGNTVKAKKPVHGKASLIKHNGKGLFQDLPNPMKTGRYHSLVCEIPEDCDLRITARSEEQGDGDTGAIMAIEHKSHPVYGVQFHPESVLTPVGIDLLFNFLNLTDLWNKKNNNNKTQNASN